GNELNQQIVKRIPCKTPFNVEFARISRSRDNAPTLIPVDRGGRRVAAQILMLSDEVNVDQARSILWRREIHTNDSSRNYIRPQTPNENSVLVEELINFRGVGIVLYTKISSNLFQPITPELLAD